VDDHVHRGEAGGTVHQLGPADRTGSEPVALFGGERGAEAINDVFVCRQQEASRATGWVGDCVVRAWLNAVDHRRDQRARSEVLPSTGLDILGALGEQLLISIALDVGALARPVLLADQVDDEPLQLGRVLYPVLRLTEDHTERAGLLAQVL
jgi:hypothetical protein